MTVETPIPDQDHRVRELAQLKLTLRTDLRFTPQYEAGEAGYLIEDAARSQFFRVGIAEYLLISMFDGSTTVGDALIRLSQLKGDDGLTENEAVALCKWLVDSELASTPESVASRRLAKNAQDRKTRTRLGTWNPLCMKLPLAYPDRLFAHITPWFRHLFGSAAAAAALVLAVIAVYKVTLHWDQFAFASGGIFMPGRWMWLLACWFLLKLVHEAAHGIVCRKYGGAVPEAGVILVLFAPLAYVDLTSSWRFRSKWKRIHTAAAGMYVEWIIAALAAIVWSATTPGSVNDLCFNVVVMAGLTTILFNANPLMRFDGYYMLSDLLEIPNLYGQGQQFLQYAGRRFFLGEKVNSPLGWSARDIFVRLYGVAAFAWRLFICACLVVAASMLFHGLGIVLAVAAVLLWVGVPLVRLFKYVFRRDGSRYQRGSRLALTTAAFATVVLLVLNGLPWPAAKRAPAVVQYEPLAFVRAASPGFVRKIHVQSGQRVDAGQPIAELENRQLVAELRDLELAVEQSLLKSRVFKQNDEMHAYQREMDQLRSFQEKRQEKEHQVQQLTLRAPVAGRVVARDLSLKLGTYLNEGDELSAIGDESRKALKIAIADSDYEDFQKQIGREINIRIGGGIVIQSELQQVDPRATKPAPQESMYASLGGLLESRSVQGQGEKREFELLQPHFTGVVQLSAARCESLHVGQRGIVWIRENQETMLHYLVNRLQESLPAGVL